MMRRSIHVVGIGGGTGLSVLLAGLKHHADEARRTGDVPIEISAIVSVADDGGSTGRLRRNLGIPAVGDLRNCLVALSHGDPLWSELFQHRFAGGEDLDGHALGNLIVAALAQRAGGLGPALQELGRTLQLGGRVLPVTEEQVILCAELEDGTEISGESRIPTCGRRVRRAWLRPRMPRPAAGVLETLASADAIVFGPGSLYTSIVPNLLVDGVTEAIRRSGALRIFACNLLTQTGETDGFDAAEHLRVLEEYLGPGIIDVCLANGAELPPEMAAACAAAGVEPVLWRDREVASAAYPISIDMVGRGTLLGRHDPVRLGRAVLSLARHLRPEVLLADHALGAAARRPANDSSIPFEPRLTAEAVFNASLPVQPASWR